MFIPSKQLKSYNLIEPFLERYQFKFQSTLLVAQLLYNLDKSIRFKTLTASRTLYTLLLYNPQLGIAVIYVYVTNNN